MRLTAFAKYDRLAASTRQRLLQYAPALRQAGIEIDYRPMFDNDYVASLAGTSRYPQSRIVSAYLKRLREVAFGPLGDVVWVYGETLPRLPAVFERLLVRRDRPIIYDFDDAFFHNYDDHANAVMRRLVGGKLEPLLRAAYACTCGNAYVRDYAARFCNNCIILPTAVDTDVYMPAKDLGEARPPVIGWIGSPSTWAYVRPLLPLLSDLVAQQRAVFRAIGAGREGACDLFPGMEAIEWSEASEVAELQRFDIGIMPVPDEQWARGKSGYKLIQYMACGLPVIASPIGVNREIVHEGKNGILATSAAEWRAAFDTLLTDSILRRAMGTRGRERVVADYSLAVHASRVVGIIKAAAERPRAKE